MDVGWFLRLCHRGDCRRPQGTFGARRDAGQRQRANGLDYGLGRPIVRLRRLAVFETQPVPLFDGLLIVGVGVTLFAIIEVEKQLRLRLRMIRAA